MAAKQRLVPEMFNLHLKRITEMGSFWTYSSFDNDQQMKVSVIVPNGAMIEVYFSFIGKHYEKNGATFYFMSKKPNNTKRHFEVNGIPFLNEIVIAAMKMTN